MEAVLLLRNERGRVQKGTAPMNPTGKNQGGRQRHYPKLTGQYVDSPGYRHATMWRRSLLKQIGDKLTHHQRSLVDEAAITKSLLDELDRWVLEHDMKDKRYLAALRERNRLTSDLGRLFVLLGLQGRKGKGGVEKLNPLEELRR